MKTLLLGGTGAMGVHLAEVLSKRGDEVFITTRVKREKATNITYIQGNAHDVDFLKEVLNSQENGWDCVVDFMVYSTIEFLDRVDLLLGKCKHYAFLSSARVYASSEAPLREDSPRLLDVSLDKEYLASDEYALTKARQENILIKSHAKHYTIVRPYITFSTYRLQLGVFELDSWLYRALQGKSIVFFKEIAQHYTTMTYGLEVAKALSCIAGNPKTHAQSYHIASSHSVRWQEILDIYLATLQKELGREVKVVFANLYEFFGERHYQVIYDRLFDRKFDNTKINALLAENGENPLGGGNLAENISLCLREFIKNPKFSYIDYESEIRKDALCNERTPLNKIQGTRDKLAYLKAYKKHSKSLASRVIYRCYKIYSEFKKVF